jgi:hypothetical protein
MFDEENLIMRLQEAGFSEVRLRDYNPDIDSFSRKHQSIYIEAVKRGSIYGNNKQDKKKIQ